MEKVIEKFYLENPSMERKKRCYRIHERTCEI